MSNPNVKKGGPSLNPNGRPKGIANKSTQELRAIMQSIFEAELPNVLESLEKVRMNGNDQKYVELMLRLAEYHVPKAPQNLDVTSGGEKITRILSIDPLSKN